MLNNYYSTKLSTYNESKALEQLLKTIGEAVSNERFQQHEDDAMSDEILITVGGIQTAFYLGGPQVQALHEFVQSIADENFYAVDFNNCIVEE